MASSFSFINKTVKGGLFFILPIALMILLFGTLVDIIRSHAQAISRRVDPQDKSGFDLSYTIAIVMLILVCFLFGLFAGTGISKAFVRWIEKNILTLFPGYQMLKTSTQAIVGMEETNNYPVVLVPVDGWMIAFEMESLANNELVVFVPDAPSPWSGSVMVFNRSDIRKTSLTQKEAIFILKHTGHGLKDL